MGSFPETYDDRPLLPCVGRATFRSGFLSNDDGDVNENDKKRKRLNKQNTNFSLHVHHTFLHISLLFLHDYD